jgi:hypothetical protein
MRYDTKQGYQAPPRYEPPTQDDRDESTPRYEPPVHDDRDQPAARYESPAQDDRDEAAARYESPVHDDRDQSAPRNEPGYDGRDEAAPRYEPPAWHDAETARTEPTAAPPSDLDAAAPEAVAAPTDTDRPDVARGEAAVPVDTPARAEPTDEFGKLWPEDAVHDFQQRWREVQLHFVDDPRAAADEAQQLVAEALDRFSTALSTRRSEMDSWREGDGADTERMLTVVRRYRKLLDRLLEV